MALYMLNMLTACIVFLFGLVIGSFLNACIYRIPRQESIVRPPSHCPHCRALIRPHHNIPLLSFLLLRGRCASCGESISWRYPAVELLTGVVFVLLYLKFGISSPFLVNVVFASALLVLSVIDLYERILPDVITLPGIVIGWILAPFQAPEFLGHPVWITTPALNQMANSLLGVLVGGGFLWVVAWLYLRVRGIEGLGFGDIKLMAMIGAFIGWQFAWLTIFFGSFLGAIIGAIFILTVARDSRYWLPFGTFLGTGAILVTLYGTRFMDWYLSRS